MRRSCRICEGCQRPLSTKARFHKCEPVKPKPTCLDCAAPVYRSGLRCGNCKPSLDLIRNEITQRRSGPCTETFAFRKFGNEWGFYLFTGNPATWVWLQHVSAYRCVQAAHALNEMVRVLLEKRTEQAREYGQSVEEVQQAINRIKSL